MKPAPIKATPNRMTGTSHQRRRRGGRTRVHPSAPSPPPSSGPASTISSVVSGLMVSLAVVVAAILAVLVLVFSDQPATEQVQRIRARRGSRPQPRSPTPALAHVVSPVLLRGPPPARVLQRQLALPTVRPRAAPVEAGARPIARPSAPVVTSLTATAETVGDIGDERGTFLERLRSTIALLGLVTLVGTTVAALIGI